MDIGGTESRVRRFLRVDRSVGIPDPWCTLQEGDRLVLPKAIASGVEA